MKKKPTKKLTAKKTRKTSTKWPKITRFTYVRYLPAVAIAFVATFLSLQPQSLHSQNPSVLAYATNVSPSDLLSGTNTQRTNNGVATLALNGKLASAAQAKADDMVARNYWSHATPDGKQPWTFVVAAGYQYTSAGENLAYGFMTSGDTITGWMNSAPHKANLLSTNFTEVGFGIANSPDYVGDGPQTVIVAMYGKPQAATAPIASAPTTSTPKSATKPAATTPAPAAAPAPEPAPAPVAAPIEQPTETPVEEAINSTAAEVVQDPVVATATNVRRVQLFANGSTTWTVTAVVLAVVSTGILWIIHKGFHIKRYLVAGENYILHHMHIDLAVLSIIYLGFVLLGVSGSIR